MPDDKLIPVVRCGFAGRRLARCEFIVIAQTTLGDWPAERPCPAETLQHPGARSEYLYCFENKGPVPYSIESNDIDIHFIRRSWRRADCSAYPVRQSAQLSQLPQLNLCLLLFEDKVHKAAHPGHPLFSLRVIHHPLRCVTLTCLSDYLNVSLPVLVPSAPQNKNFH